MFLHFQHSPKFSKAKRTQKNKQTCRTGERMATRMLCFRDGVCVLVQLWPCLLFLFLVSSPARASRPSLVSVFVFVLVSWLSLSSISLLLCVNLCCLLAAAAGSGWGASTSCKRESRRPLAPLALNKENFAVVASRSMTHHS